MMPDAVHQQDLEAIAGVNARELCTPAALLYLARVAGYEIPASTFMQQLEWQYWQGERIGWSRAGLASMLRERYGVASASWWTAATGAPFTNEDLIRMRAAGYVDLAHETAFLETTVAKAPRGIDGVLTLVASGHRVAVTVKSGFGKNSTTHTVVLVHYDAVKGTVLVFDPDSRNPISEYNESYIREYVAPDGACSVVLRLELA